MTSNEKCNRDAAARQTAQSARVAKVVAGCFCKACGYHANAHGNYALTICEKFEGDNA